jgi:hypothetical protein
MILAREKCVDFLVRLWFQYEPQRNRILKCPLTFDYKNVQILVQLLTMPANNIQTPIFSARISWIRFKQVLMKITL